MSPMRRRKRGKTETIARKTRKKALRCALCTVNVYYEPDEEIFSGNEKECFQAVLSLLEVSTGSILPVADEWDSEEYTFCSECGKFVKEGLAMLKEIKVLQQKVQVVKKEVMHVLVNTGVQEHGYCGSRGSQAVRSIMRQCYQPCFIPVEKIKVNPNVGCLSREPRHIRKAVRNKSTKMVPDTPESDGAVSLRLKSTIISPERIPLKDCVGENNQQMESIEIADESCGIDSYSDPEEEVTLTEPSTNFNADTLEEHAYANAKMPIASLHELKMDPKDRTESPFVIELTPEVESPMEDGAKSPVRRSLRTRQQPQRFTRRIKMETEASKHACGVCKIEFTDKLELAKHFWGEHTAHSGKNILKSAVDNAVNEQSEVSEDEEFVALSDASSEDSDQHHPVKKRKGEHIKRRYIQEKGRQTIAKIALKCPFCETTFDRLGEYDFLTHIYSEHKLTFFTNRYGCHKCGEIIGFQASDPVCREFVLNHANCEVSVEANACKFCDYVAADFIDKLRHNYFSHTPKTDLRCDICVTRKLKSDKIKLRHHRSKAHGIPFIRVPMNLIGLKTTDSEDMNELLNYYYTGEKEFETDCRICDISFERRTHEFVAKHYRDSHKIRYYRGFYGCVVCNVIYDDTEENLKDFQECHKKCCPRSFPDKSCVCTLCGEKGNDYRGIVFHYLSKHLKRKRAAARNYNCKYCLQKFKPDGALVDHIQQHHPEVMVVQLLGSPQGFSQALEHGKSSCPAIGEESQSKESMSRIEADSSSTLKGRIMTVVQTDAQTFEVVFTPTDSSGSTPVENLTREISATEFVMDNYKLNRLELRDFVLQPSDRACLLCDFISETGSFVALMAHIFSVHRLIFLFGLYGCKNCGSVTSKEDLNLQGFCEQHMNCTPSSTASFCVMCNFSCSNFFQIMGHYKEAHFNAQIAWIFSCKACNSGCYYSVAELIKHFKLLHQRPNLTLKTPQTQCVYPDTPNFKSQHKESCALCPEVFCKEKKLLLPNHVSVAHKLNYYDGTYGCGVCGTLYTGNSKCGINEFARKHADCESERVPFKCENCSQVFEEYKNLVLHCKSQHESLNQVWCFVCGESYVSVAVLKAHHLRSKHCSQSSESVPPPGKPEADSIKLDVITALIRGPIPREGIQCELCDQKFSKIQSLAYHRRTVHKLVAKLGVMGCLTCLEVFIRKPGYTLIDFKQEHETCIRNNETAFDCHLCEKKFNDVDSKYFHYSYHHAERICAICDKKFTSRAGETHHMRKVHPKPEAQIETDVGGKCEENAVAETVSPVPFTEGNYIYFVKELPEEIENHICKLCGESFDVQLPIKLAEHVKREHGLLFRYLQKKQLYLCPCCYTFYEPGNDLSIEMFAQNHATCSSLQLEDEIPCNFCASKFEKYTLLCRHHLELHAEKTLECAGCIKKFVSWQVLFRHMRECHVDLVKLNSSVSSAVENMDNLVEDPEAAHECLVCKTIVENRIIKGVVKSRIAKHYRNHHKLYMLKRDRKPFFACNGCSELCLPKTSLDAELPAFVEAHRNCPPHEGDMNCRLCGRVFVHRYQYFTHYFFKHIEKQAMPVCQCHICGKSFKTDKSLRLHMHIHNKSYPFTCRVCNRGCQNRNQLRDHLRTHTGEKPYVCDVCGMSFALGVTMRHHRGLHDEQIRNVPCPHCDKLFTNNKNLWSHIREVHRRSRAPRRQVKKQKPKKVVYEDESESESSS